MNDPNTYNGAPIEIYERNHTDENGQFHPPFMLVTYDDTPSEMFDWLYNTDQSFVFQGRVTGRIRQIDKSTRKLRS